MCKIMSLLKIKIVNVKREGSESNDSLIIDLKVLDRAYPEIAIEFIELEGVLDPKSSMNLSKNGISRRISCLLVLPEIDSRTELN
jgi:hypothetical protein